MSPDPVPMSLEIHAQARTERLHTSAARRRRQRLAAPRCRPVRPGARTRMAGALRQLADRLEPRRAPRRRERPRSLSSTSA